MARRTLQLIQILFVFFAIYSIYSYSGYQQKIIPIFCLLAVFGLEKLQGSSEPDSFTKTKKERGRGRKKEKKKETRNINVDNLLKSPNPLIVADAVQYLFHDLGLFVTRAPQSQVISRLVQTSVEDVPIGVIVLRDISKINTTWKEWDVLEQFAVKYGKGYRTLFIWSNCFENKSGDLRSRTFPDNVAKLFARKNVVAMGTDTFHSIYDLCISGKVDIRGVLEKIRTHSGGVISLKK